VELETHDEQRTDERDRELAQREAEIQGLEAELLAREAELSKLQAGLAARQEELRRRERRLEDAERLRERVAAQPIAPYVSFTEGIDALAAGGRRERES
jgi:uncharacterized protein (DUF3084 family)